MKKILAMLMAFAMVTAVSAATTVTESTKTTSGILFNRGQFQPHKATAAADALTVPMIYKGTMSFDGWYALAENNDGICEVDTLKVKYDLFMTICQPCLDCFPCELLALDETDENTPAAFTKFGADAEASPITRWNLYIVKTNKKDVVAYKINLMANHGAVFFTGAAKKNAYVAYGDVQPERLILQNLVGKKSDFKFPYLNATYADGEWTVDRDAKKATAYIKSITSMSGDFTAAWGAAEGMALVTGTAKLTRNASLTTDAIVDTFTTIITTTTTTTTTRPDYVGKGWEDCEDTIVDTDTVVDVAPASICEAYIDGGAFEATLAEKTYKNKNFTIEDEAAFGAYFGKFTNLL